VWREKRQKVEAFYSQAKDELLGQSVKRDGFECNLKFFGNFGQLAPMDAPTFLLWGKVGGRWGGQGKSN